MPTFTETQKNPFRWYLVVFLVVIPILIYWSAQSNNRSIEASNYLLLMLGAYFLPAVFLMVKAFSKTTYQIDEQGIHYRVKPLEKWRAIPWTDIDRAYVRDFRLMGEHQKGSVGVQKRPKGRPYIIKAGPDGRVFDMSFDEKGDFGLQINKKTGSKMIFGTQRPDELQAFLATLPIQQKTESF
jgi:hypothetical protein